MQSPQAKPLSTNDLRSIIIWGFPFYLMSSNSILGARCESIIDSMSIFVFIFKEFACLKALYAVSIARTDPFVNIARHYDAPM